MQIQKAYDKGSRPLNEDVLLIGENIFGVFDGTTGHDRYADREGKTSGYLAASITKEIFEEGGENRWSSLLN